MVTISAILMGKDELKYFLKECIESLLDVCDEIIYVDTGSNDNTVQYLADNYSKVKVYCMEWPGWEKSNMIRNFAISKATSDYILAIDCDEVLGKDKFALKKAIEKYPDVEAFHIQGEHYMYDLVHIDRQVNTHMWLYRLFKNDGRMYPENQHGLVPAEKTVGIKGDFIHHYGYCKNMADAIRRYDENTGDKNEFPNKEDRETYLKWQLYCLITGKFPRKMVNLEMHPKEIQKKFHMEYIEPFGRLWFEKVENNDK